MRLSLPAWRREQKRGSARRQLVAPTPIPVPATVCYAFPGPHLAMAPCAPSCPLSSRLARIGALDSDAQQPFCYASMGMCLQGVQSPLHGLTPTCRDQCAPCLLHHLTAICLAPPRVPQALVQRVALGLRQGAACRAGLVKILPVQASHAPRVGVRSGVARVHHGGLQCAGPVAWLAAQRVGFRAPLDSGI